MNVQVVSLPFAVLTPDSPSSWHQIDDSKMAGTSLSNVTSCFHPWGKWVLQDSYWNNRSPTLDKFWVRLCWGGLGMAAHVWVGDQWPRCSNPFSALRNLLNSKCFCFWCREILWNLHFQGTWFKKQTDHLLQYKLGRATGQRWCFGIWGATVPTQLQCWSNELEKWMRDHMVKVFIPNYPKPKVNHKYEWIQIGAP